MNQEGSIPPIRYYLILSFFLNTLFLTAAILLMVIVGVGEKGFFFVLFPHWIIVSPVAGIVGWLIDKGSDGRNKLKTLKVIGGVSGMFYGAVAGAAIGVKWFGQTGAILGFISFYFLAALIGTYVEPLVGRKLARYMGISLAGKGDSK